jgi:exosome complex component RRP42
MSYIKSLLEKDMREDGRKLDQYRDIKVEYGVSSKSAEGSARVRIGDTEVVAGIKMEVGEPFPDSPDQGVLIVNAELVPLASPDFQLGPPDIESIELARVVDRTIRESKTIDLKKLCIKKGEKVWIVFIDVYPINDSGNLFDACSLAAIAALKDAKFPELTKKHEVNYKKHTKKMDLKGLPISCTIGVIGDKFLIDPSVDERKELEARLTIGVMGNKLCALQKGGDRVLSIDEIDKIIALGLKKVKELEKKL